MSKDALLVMADRLAEMFGIHITGPAIGQLRSPTSTSICLHPQDQLYYSLCCQLAVNGLNWLAL